MTAPRLFTEPELKKLPKEVSSGWDDPLQVNLRESDYERLLETARAYIELRRRVDGAHIELAASSIEEEWEEYLGVPSKEIATSLRELMEG